MSTAESAATTRQAASTPSAIIVGAGPAGLAVAACLVRASVSFTVLEQQQSVAASWRGHYDRLHLHTNKGTSALPFMPFPRDYPRYPSRDQMIDYIETYARTFSIEPKFNEEVLAARRRDGRWEVTTRTGTYAAPHLVIATGLNREAVVPQWPGQENYRGRIMHSRDYRNGRDLSGCPVLVVGIGNSGGEIAIDLHEHAARPTIAVRGPVNVLPRDILGIPIVVTAMAAGMLPPRIADAFNAPLLRLVVGNLRSLGLQAPRYGSLTQIARTGRIPMIDVGAIDLIKRGAIAIRPGIEQFVEDGVVFTDGRREAFHTVILATGFRARVDRFLEAEGLVDEHGNPRRNASLPEGLHFCGFNVVASGLLNRIGRDAKSIAAQIASDRAA
jgi:indole-3-pyruvate monooxygenase